MPDASQANTGTPPPEMFPAVADVLVDGIVSADQGGRIAYVNPAAATMFGYGAPELVGQPLTILMPLRFHDPHRQGFARYAATGEARVLGKRLELVARRRDGSEFPVELTISRNPGSRRQAFVAVVNDITRRRRLEAQAATSQKAAQDLENLHRLQEFKTRFINNTAHQLSTPLTPIKIQLRLLRERLSARRRDDLMTHLEPLERATRRLEELVRGVLDAAMLQSEQLGLQREHVDLGRCAALAVESMREQADVSGVALETRLLPGAVVSADPRRLGQVLANLLSNAVKFNHPGGSVLVETFRERGAAVFRVTDTGFGLAPERREAVFEPYSQQGSAEAKELGAGLGLYVSRGIVELHGGHLWCESQGLGRGSRFCFELPLVETASAGAKVAAPLMDQGRRA